MKCNILVVLSMVLALGLLGGCDATSGGVQVRPSSSPFPYNSPHG